MDFLNRKKKQQSELRQPSLMKGQDGYTFRRSRTLTGSISSAVRAAAEDRSHLKSPRLKLHELQRHQRLVTTALVFSAVAVISLGWVVGQFIRMPQDLTYAQQTLNAQPDTDRYRLAVKEYFSAYPTERFLFRLNSQQLTRFVSDKHSEVKSVDVSSIGPGMFDISVELREPVLSWRSGGSQLYVDKEGVSFRGNYFTEPAVAVDDQSGIRLDNTNAVASNRFIEFLGRIVSGVDQQGMKVNKIVIPAGTTREVDIQLESRNFVVKTHIDREPSSQAQDVVNAVAYLDRQGIVPEYIDVRVQGKAFYR